VQENPGEADVVQYLRCDRSDGPWCYRSIPKNRVLLLSRENSCQAK